MDKFMNNHWFMKIIALLLALMLYMSVNIELSTSNTTPSGLNVTNKGVETLSDIPLQVFFDEENLVISGVPETVDITIDGPTSIIKPILLQREFPVFVDLVDYGLGTHKVKVKYKDVSDKLNIAINPNEITVHIQEKISKNFPVGVEFINQNKIVEGYKPLHPTIDPAEVTITGAKEMVESVKIVKAIVDLNAVDETFKQEGFVKAYDAKGNLLDLQIEPKSVQVIVSIESPKKVVPLKITPKGNLAEGLRIMRIDLAPKEVEIYGPLSVIEKIKGIDIPLNYDEISMDSSFEVEIPIPEGIEKMNITSTSVKVEVEKVLSKNFQGVPISIIGLDLDATVEFLSPIEESVDVEVVGVQRDLDLVSQDQLGLYIDLKNLEYGEHEIFITKTGPENISLNLSQNKAKVIISEK